MPNDRNRAPVNGYWRQVEEIFHLALDRPAEARAAFIAGHCAGDATMERDVREILAGFEAQARIGESKFN